MGTHNGHRGRKPGSLNRRTIAGAEWALGIIESQDYKDSIMRRIKNDNLDPRVEQTILHYAYGRPVERVEAKVEQVPEGTLDAGKNAAQIAEEAQALASLLLVAQNADSESTEVIN